MISLFPEFHTDAMNHKTYTRIVELLNTQQRTNETVKTVDVDTSTPEVQLQT